jgi:hypothetical protein
MKNWLLWLIGLGIFCCINFVIGFIIMEDSKGNDVRWMFKEKLK